MNHYLFIKEDNDSFYELDADNIKEAIYRLIGEVDGEKTKTMFKKCLSGFNEDDTSVVDLYNKFINYSDERISRVMVTETIYDDRYCPNSL